MAKTPAYTITTADDVQVDARTEGKAADKLAAKLTAETGLVHRVYTPTGKLRLETEVVEPAPAEDVQALDFHDVIAEVIAEAAEDDAAAVTVREMTIVVTSFAEVMAQLKADDETVRANAEAEWAHRLEIYKKRTNAKNPAERIVGPAMAAALERGETTDGRTVASLAKRGLVARGEGLTFTVNEAGRAALAAAVEAVALAA
jgi:hypothetical protein